MRFLGLSMKNKKVFIHELLNCNRRKLDAYKFYKYFSRNNYEIVTNLKKADIIILNTCAYSNKRKEIALNEIKFFQKYDAELIVTGCLPEIDKEELEKIFSGKTVSTKNIEKIDDFFPENKIKFEDIDDANFLWEDIHESRTIIALKKIFGKSRLIYKINYKLKNHIFENLFWEDTSYGYNYLIKFPYFEYLKSRWDPRLSFHRDTYFIRPSWGCLGNCSYCAIKKAIGRLKSKPLEEIIKEFKKGLDKGYKKFMLDADDLGAYGMDINSSNFPELLDKITDISGDYVLNVRYIHPQWIVRYIDTFEDVLKKGKIHSVGISIQSGSTRILQLMHRYSNVDRIKEIFPRLFKSNPGLLLSTECINGFPTETVEEFQETLDFIKELRFHWGYIFPFSCKLGTPVEQLEPKITNDEILRRMNYAKTYFRNFGYDSSFFKNSDILVFRIHNTPIIF